MDTVVQEHLIRLNRTFYDAHAEAFADSRPRLAAGILHCLAGVMPGAHVLDLGCGDGKVGRWLARQSKGVTYLGLDASAAMLERARRYSAAPIAAGAAITFLPADLTQADWPSATRTAPYDLITAFAVLHHIPSLAERTRIIQQCATRLAPGGRLWLSTWHFTRSARLRQRVADWSAAGLAPDQVEAGDFLLTWERAGRTGLRYVHVLEAAELDQLAAMSGLVIGERFAADGATHTLADYTLMQKTR